MSDLYILDEAKKPVPVGDVLTWGKWFESGERRVAQDVVGDVRISTVFLGMDHGFGSSEPVLFETMVFGGALADEMERYGTWTQAEAGHAAMVERVKALS